MTNPDTAPTEIVEPVETTAPAETSATTTQSAAQSEFVPQPTPRRHTRVSTIVWGAILVGIGVFAILILTIGPLTGSAILWSVVGFGALLLLAALVAAIVRAAQSSRREHPPIG